MKKINLKHPDIKVSSKNNDMYGVVITVSGFRRYYGEGKGPARPEETCIEFEIGIYQIIDVIKDLVASFVSRRDELNKTIEKLKSSASGE